MRQTTLLRVVHAMNQAGIPKSSQDIVTNALRATSAEDRADVSWAALLTALAYDRRAVVNNLSTRPPYLRPHYDAYIQIMDKVRESMEVARTKGSPEDAQRAADKANVERAERGLPPNGRNTNQWPTWVPPRVRESLLANINRAYIEAGYTKGSRFMPFTPPAKRRELKERTDNTLATIKRIRSTHASVDGGTSGYTPYRALHLAAARMAEKALYTRLKGYELGTHNTIDHPLPVNWLALLDAPMRARLREAQVNPNAVTLDGLDHFYEPPRGITSLAEMPELTEMDAAHAQEHGLEVLTDTEGTEDGLDA